jgi:hypothetical protein
MKKKSMFGKLASKAPKISKEEMLKGLRDEKDRF